MQDKKAFRLAFPVVALAFCAAAAVVWLHHGTSLRVDELVSDCGTLCQARNLILNTKNALDNKAEAELMLLRVILFVVILWLACRKPLVPDSGLGFGCARAGKAVKCGWKLPWWSRIRHMQKHGRKNLLCCRRLVQR
jgi:hypothetical protein